MTMDPAGDLIVRAALALVFASAAVHKLGDVGRFRATVADYRLVPERLVAVSATAVVSAEILVAALLALPWWRAAGAIVAATVLVGYGGAIAINLVRGRRHIDCGCTGPAGRQPIGTGLVIRNGVLAAAALTGLLPLTARPLVWVDALTVVGATGVLAAVWVAAHQLLAQEPAVTRLRGDA